LSLFSELKRRNVIRVSVAYLALGWIVTQVTSTVAPMLHLPPWVAAVVLWIGVIGFPFVVMFSWIYELTPEGLKKDSEVNRSESITRHTARRLDLLIIGLLVGAMALFVLDRVFPRGWPSGAASPIAVTPAVPASQEKSVAVLPFADMSQAKDQEYFSDGISEELLNLLAQVPELRVASRTSSFAFKGKEVGIQDIARQLNVTHVLEGSVRKSGNRIRVTAQLIRASDGYHAWSNTWDRELTDIFAVQDEIAAAVVAQMKVTLLNSAPKSRVTDPEAYTQFLQARELGLQFTAEGFEKSTALLKQVVAKDPTYVEAWRLLARDSMNRASNGLQSVEEGYSQAREYINKALAIDPNYGRAHDGLASIAMSYDLDLATAAREWNRALELDPRNLDIVYNAAALLCALGRVEQCIEVAKAIVSRDPVTALNYTNVGWGYIYARQFDKAADSFQTALSLDPSRFGSHSSLSLARLLAGDEEGALAAAAKEPSEMFRLTAQATAYHALGKQAESDAALEQLIHKYERSVPFAIAGVYAYRRENDQAFAWLDKAVAYHDPALSGAAVDPMFGDLHDDSRWLPFLRKHGMAPEQVAAIQFEVKIPTQ
jgi:TolB-like protein/cytochrome c-type biogenesis protein CcmH/NrfG